MTSEWHWIAFQFTHAAAHFLWQGTLIALATAALLPWLRHRPHGRHALLMGSLVLLALCLPANFALIHTNATLGLPDHKGTASGSSLPTPASDSSDHSRTLEPIGPIPSGIPARNPQTNDAIWSTLAPPFVTAYALGLAAMCLRLSIGFRYSQRLRRRAKPLVETEWLPALKRVGHRLKLKSLPALAWSTEVATPVVVGIFRPIVVVPQALLSSFTVQQIESILAHELAHLRRFDPWIVALQRSLETILFFHPAIWWASRQMDQAREEACDDIVLTSGIDPAEYATALLHCSSAASPTEPIPALAASGPRAGSLRHRILRILGHSQNETVRPGAMCWIATGLLVLAGFGATTPFSQAEITTSEPSSESANESGIEHNDDYAAIPIREDERPRFQEIVQALESNREHAIKMLRESAAREGSSARFDFLLGNLDQKTGRFESAKKHFQTAIEKHDRFARAHKNLGVVCVQSGDYEQAATALQRAQALGEEDATTHGLLGYSLLNLKDYTNAESAYQKALELAPGNRDWELGLVQVLLASGKNAKAAALLERYPLDPQILRLQAIAYQGMKSNLLAAKNYELIHLLEGSNHKELKTLGDLYVSEGLFSAGSDAYRRAVEAAPEAEKTALNNRSAQLLTNLGAYDEAEHLLKLGNTDANPTNDQTSTDRASALKLQAKIRIHQNDIEPGIQLLKEALRLDPNNGETMLLLGQQYGKQGNLTEAIQLLERAAQHPASGNQALIRHAQLLVEIERYEDAIVLLKKALSQEPKNNVEAYLKRIEELAARAPSKANEARTAPNPEPISIAIDTNQRIVFQGREIGIEGIRPLIERRSSGSKPVVKISSARDVPSAIVLRVVTTVKEAGAERISISTYSQEQTPSNNPPR